MAINYYIGKTREELERELGFLQDQLHKVTIRANSAEVGVQSQTEISVRAAIAEIYVALRVFDPVLYSIENTTRITRTKVVFSATAAVDPTLTQ